MKKNIKLHVAQINSSLGDFDSNTKKICQEIVYAKNVDADLIVFPEAALFGYHPFDLLEREELVKAQYKKLKYIEKKIPSGLTALIGLFTTNKSKRGRPFYNSVALIQKGKKTQFFHKEILPVGDVFDEGRFIEKGNLRENFFNLKGNKIFLTICEDIWAWPDAKGNSIHANNPLLSVPRSGVDLVLNLSASPFFPDKFKQRQYFVQKTAKFFKAPMLYVNMVGAQDEIIYDGQSFACDQNGKTILKLAGFSEDRASLMLSNKKLILDKKQIHAGHEKAKNTATQALLQALILGIRDFAQKNKFNKIHLGLSGGIDSALVACLAARAIGPENITCVALPSQFNDPISLTLAKELCENIKVNFVQFPIQKIYEISKGSIDEIFGIQQFGLVHENLQARIRGLVLMAYANNFNSLLLTTSNKSEYAVGYSTLYGDMCGGLAPIGDLTKGQVVELCIEINRQQQSIPREIITRPPSAELRPNQRDQDSLPDYDLLDQSVVRLIERMQSVKSSTDDWTLQKINRSEFKRWQAPPILKVSSHAFGRGRRYPITYKGE